MVLRLATKREVDRAVAQNRCTSTAAFPGEKRARCGVLKSHTEPHVNRAGTRAWSHELARDNMPMWQSIKPGSARRGAR